MILPESLSNGIEMQSNVQRCDSWSCTVANTRQNSISWSPERKLIKQDSEEYQRVLATYQNTISTDLGDARPVFYVENIESSAVNIVPYHFLPLLLVLDLSNDEKSLFHLMQGRIVLIFCMLGLGNIFGRIFSNIFLAKTLKAKEKRTHLSSTQDLAGFRKTFSSPFTLNAIVSFFLAGTMIIFPWTTRGLTISSYLSEKTKEEMLTPFTRISLFFLSSFLFGFASATLISLRSSLIVELFGSARLMNAFNYLLIFQGIGTSLGSPLMAVLSETTCGYMHFYTRPHIAVNITLDKTKPP
ncbi:hypothetical protein Ciccas_006313 [Cichlidogyrus casuarinus]|uniref:Uncharacterized protein n=1 Tax=Cichlidogyrus casuarinus TaxID=1844966 RepID=A0ABD2Q742_9PLAT